MSTGPDRRLLSRWLQDYRPADATEERHRARMLELVEAPGDPFRRDHFQPGHFTASAFVRSPAGTDVLLIHHGKLARWLQPGGHVDACDGDLVAAARREVAEETGLTRLTPAHDGIFDLDVHAIPAHKSEPAHRHYDVRFLFRATDVALRHGSDARDARWVPLGQVDALGSDRSVARALAKLMPGAT